MPPPRRSSIDRLTQELTEGRRGHNRLLELLENLLTYRQGLTPEERDLLMATKETLERMQSAVKANTDTTQSAILALQYYNQQHEDDLKALREALTNSDAHDEPEVKAALEAIEKNNEAMKAAIPKTAADVVANTGAPKPKAPAVDAPKPANEGVTG